MWEGVPWGSVSPSRVTPAPLYPFEASILQAEPPSYAVIPLDRLRRLEAAEAELNATKATLPVSTVA
jgi:hypothetical protein